MHRGAARAHALRAHLAPHNAMHSLLPLHASSNSLTSELASTSNLKGQAKDIFLDALKAADPKLAVHNALRVLPARAGQPAQLQLGFPHSTTSNGGLVCFDLSRAPTSRSSVVAGVDGTSPHGNARPGLRQGFDRVVLVAFGKAAVPMAEAAETILGDHLTEGQVITKTGHSHKHQLHISRVVEARHPVPDQAGVDGTQAVLKLVQTGTSEERERTLILFLISGGASSLLCCPAAGLSLQDLQRTNEALLACGATINQVNVIRKHLSKVKAGRLAAQCGPATTISLVLSDIVGDPLHLIGSGPTVPDTDQSSFQACLDIVKNYALEDSLPKAVWTHLRLGAQGLRESTPNLSTHAECFARSHVRIIGNNALAVARAERKARALGFHTLVLSTTITGEAREVAQVWAAIAKEVLAAQRPVNTPACIIAGGETTVHLTGKGLGGRNQEMALAAGMALAELREQDKGRVVILCGATDGTDGPTDSAGGVVDGHTCAQAEERGLSPLDYLQRSDSYHFFQRLEDDSHLMTGPTGTNVMDISLILVR